MKRKPLFVICAFTVFFVLGAPARDTNAQDEPAAAAAGAEAGAEGAEAGAEAGAAGTAADMPQPTYGGLSLGTIKPPTAEEEAALKELAEDIEIYNRNAEDFRNAIKNIIQRQYELRKKQIEEELGKQIEEEERLEDEARKSAIEYFEVFLAKYPDNDEYTPDAMFRLSELYYEQSYVDHLNAYDDYRDELKQWKKNPVGEEPREPSRDFTRTIAISPSFFCTSAKEYLLEQTKESHTSWASSNLPISFQQKPRR